MADAIKSSDLTATAPAKFEPVAQVNNLAAQNGDGGTVMVKPVRTFMGDEGMKSPGSDPFSVSRSRAAELRANGLVEYVNDADEEAEIKATVQATADARRQKRS